MQHGLQRSRYMGREERQMSGRAACSCYTPCLASHAFLFACQPVPTPMSLASSIQHEHVLLGLPVLV